MLDVAGMMKWAVAGLSGLAFAAAVTLAFPVPEDARFRTVALPDGSTLSVMVREVTRREWRACAEAGACEDLTGAIPAAEPDKPMTGVNRFDVDAYLGWAKAVSGRPYRLPTADEWKSIAAALPRRAATRLFDDPRLAWAADYGSMPAMSGILRASGGFGRLPNGISDLAGNVWEWTATCARAGFTADRCPAYEVEGEHEAALSVFVREPFNGGCAAGTPPNHVGFRLVSGP